VGDVFSGTEPVKLMMRNDSVTGLVLGGIRANTEFPALVCADSTWTHADLDRYSGAVAAAIQGMHFGRDARVALVAERRPMVFGALLGIVRSGCAVVPLDPSLPEAMRRMMLSESGAKLVLSEFGTDEAGVPGMALPDAGKPCAESMDGDASRGGGEDLLYVLFTSGSTGVPKGVMMPHRAIANLMRWQGEGLPVDRNTVVLQYAAPGFDVMFQEILPAWAGGGSVVLIDEETRRDPVLLWRVIASRKVTRLFLPVVVLRQMAAAWPRAGVTAGAVAVRDVIVAGEALRIDEAIRRLFGALPGCRLHNHYGPTETHVVTSFTLEGDPSGWPTLPPIGRPIGGTTLRIESVRGIEVERGEAGEIVIGGLAVARGYLGREEQTRERFEVVEAGGGARYRTGDLGRRNGAGEIEYLGRMDRQLKIRGVRVEPGEIESAMMAYPGISEACVISITRSGEAILVGFIVSNEEANRDESEALMGRFLAARLPPDRVPSVLRRIDAMPLTASGKIDQRSLAASLDGPLPVGPVVPGASPTESVVASIWAEVLGGPVSGYAIGFFDAGGTSVGAVRVQQLIFERIGREVAVADLFRFPTVASLARHLDGETGSGRLASRVAARMEKMRAIAGGVR
jgi:amino acid adenylation domain-containing protein